MARTGLDFVHKRLGEQLTLTRHTVTSPNDEATFVSGQDADTSTSTETFWGMVGQIQSGENVTSGYNAKVGDLVIETTVSDLDSHTKNRVVRSNISYRILHKQEIKTPGTDNRWKYFCRRDD